MTFDEQGNPHLSCETSRSDNYTIQGIEEMKRNLKHGLRKMLYGLAQSMWQYDWDDRFKDMCLMSQDTVPERLLFNNGLCVCFQIGDQLHILPFVMNEDGVNIYGKPIGGHPVPIGYDNNKMKEYPLSIQNIINTRLTIGKDCVIMKNDLLGQGDNKYIDSMIDTLIDTELTINQIMLLASVPYVFNIQPEQLLTAKNIFEAIRKHYAVVFVNKDNPDKTMPVVESTGVSIDPALFDVYTHWLGNALTYLGVDYNTYEKRAQLSTTEAESQHQLTELRRLEKFTQRKIAVDRINEMFGTNVIVHSVIDELQEKDREEEEDADNDDDSGTGKEKDDRD